MLWNTDCVTDAGFNCTRMAAEFSLLVMQVDCADAVFSMAVCECEDCEFVQRAAWHVSLNNLTYNFKVAPFPNVTSLRTERTERKAFGLTAQISLSTCHDTDRLVLSGESTSMIVARSPPCLLIVVGEANKASYISVLNSMWMISLSRRRSAPRFSWILYPVDQLDDLILSASFNAYSVIYGSICKTSTVSSLCSARGMSVAQLPLLEDSIDATQTLKVNFAVVGASRSAVTDPFVWWTGENATSLDVFPPRIDSTGLCLAATRSGVVQSINCDGLVTSVVCMLRATFISGNATMEEVPPTPQLPPSFREFVYAHGMYTTAEPVIRTEAAWVRPLNGSFGDVLFGGGAVQLSFELCDLMESMHLATDSSIINATYNTSLCTLQLKGVANVSSYSKALSSVYFTTTSPQRTEYTFQWGLWTSSAALDNVFFNPSAGLTLTVVAGSALTWRLAYKKCRSIGYGWTIATPTPSGNREIINRLRGSLSVPVLLVRRNDTSYCVWNSDVCIATTDTSWWGVPPSWPSQECAMMSKTYPGKVEPLDCSVAQFSQVVCQHDSELGLGGTVTWRATYANNGSHSLSGTQFSGSSLSKTHTLSSSARTSTLSSADTSASISRVHQHRRTATGEYSLSSASSETHSLSPSADASASISRVHQHRRTATRENSVSLSPTPTVSTSHCPVPQLALSPAAISVGNIPSTLVELVVKLRSSGTSFDLNSTAVEKAVEVSLVSLYRLIVRNHTTVSVFVDVPPLIAQYKDYYATVRFSRAAFMCPAGVGAEVTLAIEGVPPPVPAAVKTTIQATAVATASAVACVTMPTAAMQQGRINTVLMMAACSYSTTDGLDTMSSPTQLRVRQRGVLLPPRRDHWQHCAHAGLRPPCCPFRFGTAPSPQRSISMGIPRTSCVPWRACCAAGRAVARHDVFEHCCAALRA